MPENLYSEIHVVDNKNKKRRRKTSSGTWKTFQKAGWP